MDAPRNPNEAATLFPGSTTPLTDTVPWATPLQHALR